ncbi:5'-methylthioadenosine/S-adenosylhomocysteine nucleosidase family protein [Aspergillus undulatus]|uniref:5'-methylthioadenosine/S-adenosylhomocysteine nucleosidase family protein n=1 Tax=Aspergillus undulatus TaxID=1810928 RepID=UPI003CCD082D
MFACMESILEVCSDAFPWVSVQAIAVGRMRKESRFQGRKLGGELFILAQEISSATNTSSYPKLGEIAKLVNTACSRREEESLDTLRRIAEAQQSPNAVDRHFTAEMHDALAQFVTNDPAYHVLLCLIADTLHGTDPDETLEGEHSHTTKDNRTGEYPTHLNDTLYTQLEGYSSCACRSGHLKWAWLRLNPEHNNDEDEDISFDLLFVASFTPTRRHTLQTPIRWKEAKISVSRRRPTKRARRVGFEPQISGRSNKSGSNQTISRTLKAIEMGQFCRLIRGQPNSLAYLHIHNNTISVFEPVIRARPRNMLPSDGTSLGQWLVQANHIPKRVKIIIAYTVARAVWQYYNSYWMMTPWTHDHIQFLQERNDATDNDQQHIFFVTKLVSERAELRDFCDGDDLVHMFPNILALAVVLIEIATGEPFEPTNTTYSWDETTLNDYYEWAYVTAKGGDLKKTVGATYEGVVNSCLDEALFRDGPIDPSSHSESADIRRSRLFNHVVEPLEKLYQAYRDDWGLLELPVTDKGSLEAFQIPSRQASAISTSDREQFSIAVFCALPKEADAVVELFDDIWTRGAYDKAAPDDNAYTVGRIGRHNVVLVHMAGMGKGVACQAASSTKSSFPGVKLAFVVGICGAVPFGDGQSEVILGDVVIGSSIVQYDLGRQYPDAFTTRARHEVHRRPPRKIQSVLSKLMSTRAREGLQASASQHLTILDEKLGLRGSSYPGSEQDELFPPDYRHKHQQFSHCRNCSATNSATDPICKDAPDLSCKQLGCDKRYLVERIRLQAAIRSDQPPPLKVHIGPVGSGDTVMKSGLHRDAIAKQHDLIAFEMEASGICDVLPFLVIKGVCDYADSHKNKAWQGYAALTAAACTKAFLEEWAG